MRVSAWAAWVAAVKPVLATLGGRIESIEPRGRCAARVAAAQERGSRGGVPVRTVASGAAGALPSRVVGGCVP